MKVTFYSRKMSRQYDCSEYHGIIKEKYDKGYAHFLFAQFAMEEYIYSSYYTQISRLNNEMVIQSSQSKHKEIC